MPLLTHEQDGVLVIIAHVSSGLSILGSVFIILSFLCFKNTRKMHSPLIFWLSVCDFMSSVAYFSFPVEYPLWCTIQGATVQFFQIGSFVWTTTIAVTLYLVLVKYKSFNKDISFMFKYFHIAAWTLCTIDVSVGLAFGVFGDANLDKPGTRPSWCWIDARQNLWKLALYFIPFAIVWTFNFLVYIKVTRGISEVVKSPTLRGNATTRIRLYMLVFMFCIGVGVVNRVQNMLDKENPLFWLNIIDAAVSPLQGFLNSIVYGMNKQLRRTWFSVLCCRKKQKDGEYNSRSPLINDSSRSLSTPSPKHVQ